MLVLVIRFGSESISMMDTMRSAEYLGSAMIAAIGSMYSVL